MTRRRIVLGALLAGLAVGGTLVYRSLFHVEPPDPALRVTPILDPALPVTFPAAPAFRFGFATVGYQSEGCLRADGSRVASNWSEWDEMGKVRGDPPDHNPRGNGFFDRYEEDLDRAAALGADAFSYAIDWSRLEPEEGKFDEAEVARVVSIVKAIRARDMHPLIVLFHWVTPAWVQSPKTGLDLLARSDRAFVDKFLPLLDRIVPPLAPLVDEWATFEEPWSIVGAEYLDGEHPPGHKVSVTRPLEAIAEAKRALVNLMYLHARVYRRVHELAPKASVGFETLALDVAPAHPGRRADIEAAERIDYIVNHHFMRAIIDGDIDPDLDRKSVEHVPELAHTLDWIGINYYQRVRVDGGGLYGYLPPVYGTPHYDVREYDIDAPHSDMWQEIAPDGLRHVIEAYARYKLPMVISENGLGDDKDDRRSLYLLEHLYTLGRAIVDGYDVRGYYCWTISDNFEWDNGLDARFGLFSVDFAKPGFPRTRTRGADLFEAVARARKIDRAVWDSFTLPAYPIGRR